MTVALGSAGNNFILGGKVAHLSAEDAYTVCMVPNVYSSVFEAYL
jgi:sterol 14-demethylase